MTNGSDALDQAFEDFGAGADAVEGALERIDQERIVPRILDRDHTVWKPDPDEIANRLGWLDAPHAMEKEADGLEAFARDAAADGCTHALLLGMGGSSLAPEVFRRVFGVAPGRLDLDVLDSTDPGAVLRRTRSLDPAATLHIVSTKSGSTVETLSLFKTFYNRAVEALGREEAGRRFVAVTDPGSKLVAQAEALAFRKVFLNDPDIGGRYSALSFFGLLPAALIGVDIRAVLARARAMAKRCAEAGPGNPGARLGAAIGSLALRGQDKLTLLWSDPLAPFGAWIEQLVAESTGKEGRGVLPVNGDDDAPPGALGEDRLFVHTGRGGDDQEGSTLRNAAAKGRPAVGIRLAALEDLGAEFFRWEFATAVAGCLLGINPFDQPNVESAKVSARAMVEAYRAEGRLPEPEPGGREGDVAVYGGPPGAGPRQALAALLASGTEGAYVSLQAFVTPAAETEAALQALRARIRDASGLAATAAFGPRFLHSTGQLHKGDAGRGLFVQFTADAAEDLPIPDGAGETSSALSFGVLERAQALGDREALEKAGRKVLRLHLGRDVPGALQDLAAGV